MSTPEQPFLAMTGWRDGSFYDPPTANNSMLNRTANLSFQSCADNVSDLMDARQHTATPSVASEESPNRRGQAYRRSFGTATTGPSQSVRQRNLDVAASALIASVEMCSQRSSQQSPPAPVPPLPPSRTHSISLMAADDDVQSRPATPVTAQRDSVPLLHTTTGATAFAAGAAHSTPNGADAEMRPVSGEDEERMRGAPAPVPAAFSALAGTLHSGGIELSLDGVMLRRHPRRLWRRHTVTYLDSCSLHIPPGSVHCIISLNPVYARCALAVLAGVDAVAQAEGAALANAYPTTALRYRRQVAYVTSLDGCMLEATVYENLLFATQVRFHVESWTERELVRQAAHDALLTGYLNVRAAALSPARRYLLAIAMELVAEPAVVLLEDPLAFFSLAELQLFVRMLHLLRHRNPHRTIVWSGVTIPWTLFDDIDSLTLLSTDGRTFFSGHKKDVEAFLQEDLGILRVPGEDVVDIMAQTELDTVAVTHAAFSFRNSRFFRQLQRDLEAHRTRIATNGFARFLEVERPPPQYLRVQWLLLTYALRRNVLGRAALGPWVGLFAVILLVCGLVALTSGESFGSLQNLCGMLFLLLSCSVQINTIFLKTELRDWRTFQSFKNNMYVSVTPYFVATVVRLVVPRLCFALAGCLCAAAIFKQAAIVSVSIMMALTSFTHACLGLVTVYWFPRFDYLMLLNFLYYGYCVIVSGFLLSISSVPLFFQGLSILRIGYGGLIATELRGLTFGCDDSSLDSGSAGSPSGDTPSRECFTGQTYLDKVGLPNDDWGVSALVLLLLSLGIMATLGISMHLTTSAKLFSPRHTRHATVQ